MALPSTQSDDPRTHLQEGEIYQRQVQQRLATALDLYGLLRLCLCFPNQPAILEARLGDWSCQKKTCLTLSSYLSRVQSKTGSGINASMRSSQILLASFSTPLVLGQRNPHQGVDSRTVRQAHDNTEGKPWLSTSWGTRMGAKFRQRSD
jgi:hypothetical protein